MMRTYDPFYENQFSFNEEYEKNIRKPNLVFI